VWDRPGVKITLDRFKEAVASGARTGPVDQLVRKFLLVNGVTKGMLPSMTIKGRAPRGAPEDEAPEEEKWTWACSNISSVLTAHVPSPAPPPSPAQLPARATSDARGAAAGGVASVSLGAAAGGVGGGGVAHDDQLELLRAALLSTTGASSTAQGWSFKPPAEGPRITVGWSSDGLGPITSITTYYFHVGPVEAGQRFHFDATHMFNVVESLLHRFASPAYLMNSHFSVTAAGSVNISIAAPQSGFTENAVYNLLTDFQRDWENRQHAELVQTNAHRFKPLLGATQEARARAALSATFIILTSSLRRITDSARVHGVEFVHAAVLRFGYDLFVSRFCYFPKTDFDVMGYTIPVRHTILQNAAAAAQRAAEVAAAAACAAASSKRSREREHGGGVSGSGGGGNSGGGGGGGGGVSGGGGGGGDKRAKSTLPEGWDARAYFDLPECLRPDAWARPLGAECCAVCGARHHKWNTHGPTSKCTGIPSASGGAGTAWRAAPRFNAFNKESYSNAFNMPAAGQSAKDANPGVEPPGKDWKPRRIG
jgi:hypothetical protein